MYGFIFYFQVQIVSLDEETSEFTSRGTFDHPYPTTKIMWIPDTVHFTTFINKKIEPFSHAHSKDFYQMGQLIMTDSGV